MPDITFTGEVGLPQSTFNKQKKKKARLWLFRDREESWEVKKSVEFRDKTVGIRVTTGHRNLRMQGAGHLTAITSSNPDHTSPTLHCRTRVESKLEFSIL